MSRRMKHFRFQEESNSDFETEAFRNFDKDVRNPDQHADTDSGTDESDKDEGFDDNSESDDAPEDLSFHASRLQSLKQIRETVEQISTAKSRMKEKRKKLQEKFTEQKKQKIESLSAKRLPDDILDDLPDEPIAPKKTKSSPTEPEDNLSDQEEDLNEIAGAEHDFIPLDENSSVNNIEVKSTKTISHPKDWADQAAAFRQKSLYGKRISRVPVQKTIGQRQKKLHRYK